MSHEIFLVVIKYYDLKSITYTSLTIIRSQNKSVLYLRGINLILT